MSKCILVVDDDQMVRSLMQELLEDEAYEVDTAIDGVDALAHLIYRHNRYDVIVLDVTMPRLDGLQFLQAIQGQDPTLLRSIIVVSGEVEALGQATRMGIGNTLKKPFDLGVLLALVGLAMC